MDDNIFRWSPKNHHKLIAVDRLWVDSLHFPNIKSAESFLRNYRRGGSLRLKCLEPRANEFVLTPMLDGEEDDRRNSVSAIPPMVYDAKQVALNPRDQNGVGKWRGSNRDVSETLISSIIFHCGKIVFVNLS